MLVTIEKKADGEPINLGNLKEVVSINEVAETIINISGKDLSIEHDLSKPRGTDNYACDMTKMKAEIGWEHNIPMEQRLQEV